MARPGKKPARLLAEKLSSELPRLADGSVGIPAEVIDVNHPEKSYASAVPTDHRKRFGQFFTPPAVADMMSEWVCASNPSRILDPAVGTGIFIRAAAKRTPAAVFTALDLDPIVLGAAKAITPASDTIIEFLCADFLTWDGAASFDGILANPPYLRHHDFNYEMDIFEAVGQRNDIRLSRLANAYVLFILEICRRLSPGGRAAIIVPGEWTNANFGSPIKRFLLDRGLLRHLVYFSHADIIFEDALTTACVLLIEKSPPGENPAATVRTYYAEGLTSCPTLAEILDSRTDSIVARTFERAKLASEPKWDFVLRNGEIIDRPGYVALSRLAGSRRGIATGANRFFHLAPSSAVALNLSAHHLKRCIGKALDASGIVFTQEDVTELEERNRPILLVDFDGAMSPADMDYVRQGELERIHERYLLAGRTPWYAMEARPPSAIWAAVFGRKRARFILNRAGIHNLTTFHCIYPSNADPDFAAALVACLNSRIVQRDSRAQSRVYGGGLLKFEPRDLLQIFVPDLRGATKELLKRLAASAGELDRAMRAGNEHEIGHALDKLDMRVEEAASQAANSNLQTTNAKKLPYQPMLPLRQA